VVGTVAEVDRDLAELCHHRDDRLLTERRSDDLDSGPER
jgi:hypothetical protein